MDYPSGLPKWTTLEILFRMSTGTVGLYVSNSDYLSLKPILNGDDQQYCKS